MIDLVPCINNIQSWKPITEFLRPTKQLCYTAALSAQHTTILTQHVSCQHVIMHRLERPQTKKVGIQPYNKTK